MSEKKLRIQILKKEEPPKLPDPPKDPPKRSVKIPTEEELQKAREKHRKQVEDALADPSTITYISKPEPSLLERYFKLKMMGLQIVKKYMATKKRWEDPKRQNEPDYLLCKQFLEECQK